MSYFNYTTQKRKKPSIIKWAIYAVVLLGAIFLFIPRFLIYKASQILEKEIPASKQTADSLPSKSVFVAYNYLKVAKFFPLGEDSANEGHQRILNYYFPLFKEDYNKLKFACVDNAINELRKQDPSANADSINIKALSTEWRKYPDNEALEEFRQNWDTYHKNFAHSLKDYPRFIDPKHL